MANGGGPHETKGTPPKDQGKGKARSNRPRSERPVESGSAFSAFARPLTTGPSRRRSEGTLSRCVPLPFLRLIQNTVFPWPGNRLFLNIDGAAREFQRPVLVKLIQVQSRATSIICRFPSTSWYRRSQISYWRRPNARTRRTADGPVCGCRRNWSGKRRPAERTAASFRGGRSGSDEIQGLRLLALWLTKNAATTRTGAARPRAACEVIRRVAARGDRTRYTIILPGGRCVCGFARDRKMATSRKAIVGENNPAKKAAGNHERVPLRDRLIADYSSYIGSFIQIRDERIRELVEMELFAGLLWPDPLIQLNPSFEPGLRVEQLGDESVPHHECRRIFRINKDAGEGQPLRLHAHQEQALRVARSGVNYVVTTGTGSGKSLTYVVMVWTTCCGMGRGVESRRLSCTR